MGKTPSVVRKRAMIGLLVATLGLALTLPSAFARSGPDTPAPKPSKPSDKVDHAAPVAPRSHYLPDRFAGRAGRYYKLIWGVDSLSVKRVESGEIVRFTWRVLDANKAQMLNDKRSEPLLVDPGAGVQLVVPSMEQIGQLRQSAPPEPGRSYWMAFSNKGRLVKRGDRVNVVIGQFRAEGLVVD